jgi:anti-sigma B factor antagonist
MEVKFNSDSSALGVTIEGDLIGGADAMTFSTSLKDAIGKMPAGMLKHVNVDAAKVGFVNSSGLGMLLAARQSAKDAGADLAILNPPEQLRSLLEITKLTDIFSVTA